MASFFYIDLDLSPPELEIFAPNYTTQKVFNIITIQSNEKLDTFQEFYLIDSNGDRHDFTLTYEEDKFTGNIRFNNVPIGIAVFYARLRDSVYNVSNLYSKTIEIKENNTISLNINSKSRSVNINGKSRNLSINNKKV